MELTVGYVSGFIALAVFVVRFLVPNILSLILVHGLGDEQTVATWSVASRDLQNSTWPALLGSDTVASRSVKPFVKTISQIQQFFLLLVAVAAVVTPLGLYGFVQRSNDTESVTFAYVPDLSNFGLGTKPRPSNFGFVRKCANLVTCLSTSPLKYIAHKTVPIQDTRLPEVLFKRYQSGLARQKPTVSSIFDIQWRNWVYINLGGVLNKDERGPKRYPVSAYRQLETHLPSQGIKLVEGLVVDYQSASIGFRNHSVPVDSTREVEWEEDLLFFEPETSCTNTNLTLRFNVGKLDSLWVPTGEIAHTKPELVDRGGFADFGPASPSASYGDTQGDAKMELRAFNGAWLNNYETMVFLNITKKSTHPWSYTKARRNKGYPLTMGVNPKDLDSISTGFTYADYLLNNRHQLISGQYAYKNPYGLARENFTYPSLTCRGAHGRDLANMKNIAVKCGLVYGSAQKAPQSEQSQASDAFNTELELWEQPIYSCASSTKALLKTVRFRYKPSPFRSLESLEVLRIRDKEYKSSSELPYWGVENTHLALRNVDPLWGLIDQEAARKAGDNITVTRSKRLYLPGLPQNDYFLDPATTTTQVQGEMNMPGANFYLSVLARLYNITSSPYSGENNFAMIRKWRQLTNNSEGTAKMLNLIWTDLSANAVMGSRGWLSTPDSVQDLNFVLHNHDSRQVPVYFYLNKVGYHWWFSVPAFLTLAVSALLALGGLICFIFGRGKPKYVEFYLNRFSPGRLMLLGEIDIDTPARKWIKEKGHERVNIRSLGSNEVNVGEVSVEANKAD